MKDSIIIIILLAVAIVFGLFVVLVIPEGSSTFGVKVNNTTCLREDSLSRMYNSKGNCYILGEEYDDFKKWMDELK
jgi:hypothetical protein